MKKLFTTAALALATLFASATDYTNDLIVTVNGASTPAQETTVTIDQEADGTYSLYLNNFMLETLPIGNIVLTGVEGTVDANDVTTLAAKDTIQITEGDLEGAGYWMGPMLGDVPIDMVAELRDTSLYFIIDIEMASLGQTISVRFGDGGYQIGNSDFEDFHTVTVKRTFGSSVTSDEPDHWHSFMSSTGTLASFVNTTAHTFISEEVRPGTSGSSSVLVTSGSVLSVVSNGTITTGRLKAGAISATSTDNNAFLDITSTDLDDNGDPFYTLLNGKPDSLSVWVKFKQGTPSETYPYATLTAVITDGSYYQEPADTDYSDIIVGSAANTQIETNDYAWQKLVLPFDYESYSASDPKAILVTISTNAEPGQGSGTDSLYVDDFELIYNLPTVTSLLINGEPLADFDPSVTEYEIVIDSTDATVSSCDVEYSGAQGGKSFVSITPNEEGNGSDVTIRVYSSDLKQKVEYVVKTRTSEASDGDETDEETGEATATLVHTASAVWGSNAGPNTVDNETEYYNNDAASSWAAAAYAEFSLSIPEDLFVTGATLTYSVNQGGNYSRDDIIYYMNAGFTLDYDYLLESTGTDLRYTDSRTVAVAAATTGGTGDRMNLTQDVTAAVQTIVNAGQDYIIFQWTGNAGGCQLYGKASEYAPTLTITTASADEMTTYTVRFVDEDDNELKSEVSYTIAIGETATASEDDMASFYSEDETIKYIYVSGNDSIVASEDADSNVITLTFREAGTYSYTVYTVVGSEVNAVATGSDFEGETVYFTYPKYYNIDGTLYSIAQQTAGSDYTSEGYFKGSFTLTQDAQTVLVEGYNADVTDVVFYAEAEDIEGLTAFSNNNADIRCSGGTAAYNAGEEPVVITTLEPGKYVLYSTVWGNSSTDFVFSAGDTDVLTLTTAGYLLAGNSEEFTLETETDITLNTQTTTGRGIDYVYIVKTGDYDGVSTGISEVNAETENASGNVYTINGIMVRKAGESLDGLAKGLYIIGGKKVVIK